VFGSAAGMPDIFSDMGIKTRITKSIAMIVPISIYIICGDLNWEMVGG